MHSEAEITQGILIGSTALMGIAAILLVQIMFNKKTPQGTGGPNMASLQPSDLKPIGKFLKWSMILAIATITLSVVWLWVNWGGFLELTRFFFIMQLLFFVLAGGKAIKLMDI